MRRALMAEFGDAEAVVRAARELRADGYRGLDAFVPFPMRELEEALGLRRSRIGWVALAGGLAGSAAAYLLQWWTSAVDYPLRVGGRPAHAPPMFVPISFEMGVLGATLGALVALLVVTGLPALWHPVFEAPGFEGATIDRFWIAVDAADPAFERDRTGRRLERLGAVRLAWAGEEGA